MKNITKITASAILFFAGMLFSLCSSAQSTSYGKIGFDIGLELGAPTGNAHKYLSNFEAGGTLRGQLGLSENLAVIVTSGYYNLFEKKMTANGITTQLPGVGIVPVKGGLKGFLGKGVYFTGEAGAGFETSVDGDTNQKDTKFILAGGLGYAMKSLDIGIRYENFNGQGFNYGLVGLRVAYSFCSGMMKKDK